jgi:putative DNA primase/helicase
VPWESNGGRLAPANGVLDLVGRTLCPHTPSLYARRKLNTAYVPDAECPLFLAFLESLFADRDRSDQMAFVGTLQCFFGASLAVPLLSREERKALILVGPSRTGKTELARFARLLIGEPIATPSVAEISERFGLSSLYDSSAWIRDDAINEGDDLDPQRFKTIVTGEPVDIDRKHRHALRGVELAMPVVLT